jgi:hypothetical protein
VLVISVVVMIIGGLILSAYEDEYIECKDSVYRFFHGDDCARADSDIYYGITVTVLGIILTIIGAILLVVLRERPNHAELHCPRCHMQITYQSSPTNCMNCGMPIDWSRPIMPRP